jgi:hypothetical protein
MISECVDFCCSQVTGRPVVCFAGEATHRQLTGTMGAAFLTGQREAGKLLAAYM